MARSSMIGVQVTGLNQVVRGLQRMGVEVEDLRDAFGRIAEQVKPFYIAATPARSGRLRGDYRTSKTKGKANLYVGRSAIPYAGPINYGWPKRGISPANFVAKGDSAAGPTAERSLDQEISHLISQLNLD